MYGGVQHFCFVGLPLLYPVLSVSLDSPFLIASSVFQKHKNYPLLKVYFLNSFLEQFYIYKNKCISHAKAKGPNFQLKNELIIIKNDMVGSHWHV